MRNILENNNKEATRLDNMIQKRLEIDNWTEQEIFEWLEDEDKIDTLKHTDFFIDVKWDRPYMNRHTLQDFVDEGSDWFYDDLGYIFEEQYGIPFNGISSCPSWIEQYDDRYLAQHIQGYTNRSEGDIVESEDLPYSGYKKECKYKLVDTITKHFEVMFEANTGEKVPYYMPVSEILIWRPIYEEDDLSSEDSETYWEF